MKQLTCEMCGSTDLVKQDGFFVCQTCGCKYSVEEAKKMMIEGTVEVQGTVKVNKNDELENLVKRTIVFIKNGEFKKAEEYSEKILDIDADSIDAPILKYLIAKQETLASLNSQLFVFSNCNSIKKWETLQENATNAMKEFIRPLLECFVEIEDDIHPDNRLIVELSQKKFYINKTITFIADSAFKGYENLTNITIPDSVTSIGSRAFEGCENLANITIPNSVTSIGWEAFEDCKRLTSITIPDSVTSIGSGAFEGCENLTNITIPNSVTSIGKGAFRDCKRLTSITIPDSVTSIDSGAFSRCENLANITIPNSVTSIGWEAFEDCKKLTSITIPDSVTSIDDSAFWGCENLKNITIPDGVTSIGKNTFYNCSGLTSVTIPKSVTSIGSHAFWGCENLTSITIPDGVTSIGEHAFSGCSSLASVTIPNSVRSIEDCAFEGCNSLTSITIPDGVTSIGKYAFYKCRSLTSVTIPKSVTSIGHDPFMCCDRLTNVTDPNRVLEQSDDSISRGITGEILKLHDTTRGCYVATCVYGSYDCPEVWTLRRYRDDTLGSTWYGRAFVRTYYAISPTLVKWFGKTKWFKKMWKGKLDRMVKSLQDKGVESTPYKDKEW